MDARSRLPDAIKAVLAAVDIELVDYDNQLAAHHNRLHEIELYATALDRRLHNLENPVITVPRLESNPSSDDFRNEVIDECMNIVRRRTTYGSLHNALMGDLEEIKSYG